MSGIRILCKNCWFAEIDKGTTETSKVRVWCHRYAPRLRRLEFSLRGAEVFDSAEGDADSPIYEAQADLVEEPMEEGGYYPWPEVWSEGWCGEAEKCT